MDDLEQRLLEFAQRNNNFEGDDVRAILQRVKNLREEAYQLTKEKIDACELLGVHKEQDWLDGIRDALVERDNAEFNLETLKKNRDRWKADRNHLLERYVAICEALGFEVRSGDEYHLPDNDVVISKIRSLKGA